MSYVTTATAGTRRGRIVELARSLPLPLLLLGGLIVARLAIAEWWLIVQDGVADTESSRHLQRAWDAYVRMGDGDTSEAAMVALSVWAILASDRFSRTGVAALAGVAVGLGLLSKQNFPVFVVG